MPQDFAARCARLFGSVQTYLDLPTQNFNQLCGFEERFASSFYRLLHNHRGPIWTPEIVEQAAHATFPVLGVSPSEVVRYLEGKEVEHAARLREFESSCFWWPRPSVAEALTSKLQKYEHDARSIIGVQRVLPVGVMPEEIYKQFYRNITAAWGDFGRRARTILNRFGKSRSTQFYTRGGYGSARAKMLLFHSDFQYAMSMRGPFKGVRPDDLHNCLTLLIEEAIGQMGHCIVLIDDRRLPANIVEHFSKHDAVILYDNDFLMKIYRGSLSRSWCERCVGPEQGRYIDEELKVVNVLMNYRMHDLTKSDMTHALQQFLPQE